MFVSFLIGAIAIGTVLLYGCLGEMLMEKSGHLNLGIPGIMCMGTAGGCLGIELYMNGLANPENASWFLLILISILMSILFSVATGAIYGFLTVTLRCNQNITGLAVTTFGTGLAQFIMSSYVSRKLFNTAGKIISRGLVNDPNANGFLRVFFSHGFFVYFAIALAIVFAAVLKRTRLGLHLRAVGENPAAADADGINVTAYKYGSIFVGSAVAGFGGLFYTMDYLKGSWENASTIESFGWLAIALVIFTLWKPNISIFGSILFGGLSITAYVLNGSSTQNELLKLLPYIITVVVLIITSIRKKRENQPPASLGLSYFREER
ncbi:MAG: ABC transporter permease [Ruminococcaceae bacterium]|nr:ABC transporter permease [Oscillospiraceae bacterium]